MTENVEVEADITTTETEPPAEDVDKLVRVRFESRGRLIMTRETWVLVEELADAGESFHETIERLVTDAADR